MGGKVHPALLEPTPQGGFGGPNSNSDRNLKRQSSSKNTANNVPIEQMTEIAKMVRSNTNKNLKRQHGSSEVGPGQRAHHHQKCSHAVGARASIILGCT